MTDLRKQIHQHIFYGSLILCGFSLSLSVFLISLSQIILLINWIAEENLTIRWQKLKKCKPLWFFILFYAIHILGLFNTSDFSYAIHDLRIKLPFLILPLILATSNPINSDWLKKILLAFISGVFLSSLFSSYKISVSDGDIMAQMKNISPLVWHIRLAVMTVFSIVVLPWLYKQEKSLYIQIIYGILFTWFITFLFILQSLTGIILLIAIGLTLTGIKLVKTQNFLLRWFILILVITFVLVTSSWLVHFYVKNFSPKPINIGNLETHTPSGNYYSHSVNPPFIENGNFVFIYLCNKELEKEWNKRSHIPIGNNNNYNITGQSLIRYLTSKGLRKDSTGIWQLTPTDIHLIENGIANSLFTNKAGFTSRIYRSMWELYHYSNGANPSGFSIVQRIIYLKTAVRIIQKNFWLGVGTGDVPEEFQKQYQADHSILSLQWRLRAHNQILTFLLTFGIFGFIAIMAALFIPPFQTKKYKDYLFGVFFLIFVISMFNEDTFETHASISFISLFYALLLFTPNTSEEKIPD